MQNEKVFDIKKRTFIFSLEIIELLKSFQSGYIADTVGRQLLRCATSVGANIIEAQSAASKRDFVNLYNIALKSANETLYWLTIIEHSEISKADKICHLINEVQEICKILARSLLTMRGK